MNGLRPVADDRTGAQFTRRGFYIVRVSTLEQELARHPLIRWSEDEIEQILAVASTFQARSPYSWRIVPTENSAVAGDAA